MNNINSTATIGTKIAKYLSSCYKTEFDELSDYYLLRD